MKPRKNIKCTACRYFLSRREECRKPLFYAKGKRRVQYMELVSPDESSPCGRYATKLVKWKGGV